MNYAFQPKPMRVHIFDVEHGECSAIETPTGDLVLIGAGHNNTTGWKPSDWLRQRNQRPHCVVLTNLDHDHLSDIPNLEPNIRPVSIKHNNHVDPNWVERKKIEESGEVHGSVQAALHWIRNVFTGEPVYPDYGMEIAYFHHPPLKFQDTNNLSVVTFVSYNGVGIMFPGDLEAAGWREFLHDQTFIDRLRRTNLLIASHHGREGGYCQEIFSHCTPHAVIISDKPIVHDTQDHNLYGQHCSGLNFDGTLRKVLTTRNDGKITIEVPAVGNYTVYVNQSY
jgi:beta-lactamase superfamily II metal-dependent hydrolase